MIRLLLVEDDKTIAGIIKYYLTEEEEGYEVVWAASAGQALAAARDQFDVILLDIMLPDVSGIDLCAQLRKWHSCPVLFISCVDNSETIIRAQSVNQGEQKYIAPNKPNASIHIDSFHDYELCILAKYLRQIPQFASDLDDAFIAEHGLTVLMDVVRSLPPLDTPYVPRDSIVREFVGGSIFQY